MAISAMSVAPKPSWSAISLLACRALTMSASVLMRTFDFNCFHRSARPPRQDGKPFFQVQRRRYAREREPKLDHREGNVGLDARR